MASNTKLTSLVDIRGLTDSVSLKYHPNSGRDSGSHIWPKSFWAVYIWVINILLATKVQLILEVWRYILISYVATKLYDKYHLIMP